MKDLSGQWFSKYRYPSAGRGADFWSTHVLDAHQDDTALHFESDTGNLSRVVLNLVCDFNANTATGDWCEETNPEGYYEGRKYEGTVEFIISPDGTRLDGTWVGDDRHGTAQSDVWFLSREPFTDSHGVDRINSDG